MNYLNQKINLKKNYMMSVKFAYNVGDVVWLMYNNKPVECEILECNYCTFESQVNFNIEVNFSYKVYTSLFDKELYVTPKEMFDSKEQLIESL